MCFAVHTVQPSGDRLLDQVGRGNWREGPDARDLWMAAGRAFGQAVGMRALAFTWLFLVADRYGRSGLGPDRMAASFAAPEIVSVRSDVHLDGKA